MLWRIRRHATYANVMATIALFAALGGTSYAAVKLSKNSVKSAHIKNGQVRGPDLATGAVGSRQVVDGSIGVSELDKEDVSDLKNDGLRVTRLRGIETSFVQRADEVVDVVAEADVTVPPSCESGISIELLMDGKAVLSGYSGASSRSVPLTVEDAGDDRLFEPGADTTRKLEFDWTIECEGMNVDAARVDVLRYR